MHAAPSFGIRIGKMSIHNLPLYAFLLFLKKEIMSIQRSVMEPFLIDTKDTHHQTCFLQLFRRICMLPLCDPLLTKGIDPSSPFFHIKSGISTLFITHETCGFHHCVIFVIISLLLFYFLDGFSRI